MVGFDGFGGPVWQAGEQRRTAVAAGFDQELAGHFGQREVEAFRGFGAGVHRSAETGAAGLAAVHRNDEDALAAGLVVRVDIGSLQEHPVLDGDGVQLAGSHGQQSELLGRFRIGGDGDAGRMPVRPPQPQQRRVQEALPGVGADGVTEQRVIAPALQAVMAARLLVGPAGGKVGDGGDVVVDDRIVAHRRAEDAETVMVQRRNQCGEAVSGDHRRFV